MGLGQPEHQCRQATESSQHFYKGQTCCATVLNFKVFLMVEIKNYIPLKKKITSKLKQTNKEVQGPGETETIEKGQQHFVLQKMFYIFSLQNTQTRFELRLCQCVR